MAATRDILRELLNDIYLFTTLAEDFQLRSYQEEPARSIIDSVKGGEG